MDLILGGRVVASAVLVALGVVVTLGGCGATSPGAGIAQSDEPPPHPTVKRDDDDQALARLSERHPGYAGHVINPAQTTILVRTTRPFSADDLDELRRSLADIDGRELLGMSIEVVSAEYDFKQLKEWYERIRNALALPGVVSTDIDEQRNRIVIGVESPRKHAPAVRGLARAQQVPLDVLILKKAGAVTPLF